MAELRRCIGSKTFGIEPHEAPVEDFPKQASQKDGLGRMCRPHWNQYTNALRKAALARKATSDTAEPPAKVEPAAESEPMAGESPAATKRRQRQEQQLDEVGRDSPEGQALLAKIGAETRAARNGKTATRRERRRTLMAHLPEAAEAEAEPMAG